MSNSRVTMRRIRVGNSRGGFPIYITKEDEDDEWHFDHMCIRRDAVYIRIRPQLSDIHQVVETDDGVTVNPSLLCPDCFLHGWIHSSKWVEA